MYRTITLPNGARILTEHIPGVRSAALGFFVGAGSRHERAEENGAAHFIEHMSFKGTSRRSAADLAYDPTMGDWRTHCGVDIAAEAGLKVLAAGEGQVEDVYSDPMMGTTVTVQQPDGITAVYSNLAEEVAVSVGDAVETGAVLGAVGGTAIAESGMESHLHLELLAEGSHVDPLDYLPEQS